MIYNCEVTPPPAPVARTVANFACRYFVTRGDGAVKFFENVYSKSNTQWEPAGAHSFSSAGSGGAMPTIDIPMDMFTAVRLGLVSFDELQLPEGFRALLNIIK